MLIENHSSITRNLKQSLIVQLGIEKQASTKRSIIPEKFLDDERVKYEIITEAIALLEN